MMTKKVIRFWLETRTRRENPGYAYVNAVSTSGRLQNIPKSTENCLRDTVRVERYGKCGFMHADAADGHATD